MLEAIGIGIVVLIWVVTSLIKGFRWFLRQTGTLPTQPPALVPPPSQTSPSQTSPSQTSPSQTSPSQTLPARAVPLAAPRTPARQPQAGSSAVPNPVTSRNFERQEQELFASEAAALNTSQLNAPPASSRSAVPANGLFADTDDLIRAIILQEVLGPPLSRRSSAPTPSSPR